MYVADGWGREDEGAHFIMIFNGCNYGEKVMGHVFFGAMIIDP